MQNNEKELKDLLRDVVVYLKLSILKKIIANNVYRS